MNIRIVTSDPLTILHNKKKKLIGVLLSDVLNVENHEKLLNEELLKKVVSSNALDSLQIADDVKPRSVEDINDDLFKDISCVNSSSFKILILECKQKPVSICLDYAYAMRRKKLGDEINE